MSGDRFVIWSMEHGAWWRPGTWGYAETLADAGLYTRDEAVAIVTKANVVHCHECMIPVTALAGAFRVRVAELEP